MKTLGAPTAARFGDAAAAAEAVETLVGLGTRAHALRAGMRDLRAQRAFCERTGIGELPHPHADRNPIAHALERMTLAGDADDDRGRFTDALVGAGIDPAAARRLEAGLDESGVLLVVPDDAPVDALQVLVGRGADLGTGQSAWVVPLRAERLEVRKRPVTDAEVVVRTDVRAETKTVEIPLEREDLVIERRPARADGTLGPVEEIRIPLRHEEAVVQKRTVVTAEVDVRKERVVEVRQLSETVRHEELRVEE